MLSDSEHHLPHHTPVLHLYTLYLKYLVVCESLSSADSTKMELSGIPTAVVTGAGGFVASQLIAELLAKGYKVRGTVRSLADAQKVQHLQKLSAALPGRLDLREADLLVEGAFDDVVKGATVVFHTA